MVIALQSFIDFALCFAASGSPKSRLIQPEAITLGIPSTWYSLRTQRHIWGETSHALSETRSIC